VKKKAGFMPNSIHAFVHPCRKIRESVFAYVGRLDEDKNPFSLLDLAAVIKKRGLDYRIRIYGDGKLKDQLEARIRKERLEHILVLMGYEADHDIIYNECKALLMLSRSEGFPLVILEANSYGKPAVIFDSFTAARDIVVDGETGFLVPPENYEGFVEKMGLVDRLAPHRISDFIWQFDNERIFPRWEALLTGLKDMEPVAKKPPRQKSSKRKIRSRIHTILSAGKEGYLNYMKKSSARENILLRQYESRSLAALRKRNLNPLISVVVPCYNSRATLPMTLRSLAKQRYKNLEILVIDDGSKDPIEDLVKAARDSRIRYFQKENEGLGLTRNFGIDQAKGKYVFFLDSDDELFPGAFAGLVRYAETKKLAVVAGQTVRRNLVTGEEEIWFPKIYEKTRINAIQTRNRLVTDALATNKLYARSFLRDNNFRFRKGLYEDLAFSAKTCCTAEKIGILSRKIYIWNIRGENTSISNQKTADNFAARLRSLDDQEQYILPRQKQDWMAFFFSHALIIYLREYHSYSDADQRKVFALARGHFMKYRDYYNPDLIWWKARRLLAMAMDADDFPWFDRICRLCFAPDASEPCSKNKKGGSDV
jgi:glycosyltransferase involved in cell wall biosynthesis